MRFVRYSVFGLFAAYGVACVHQSPSKPSSTVHVSSEEGLPRLVSVYGSEIPELDGTARDEAWQRAKTLGVTTRRVVPPLDGATTAVELRAVHTDSHIYLLATWQDGTCDAQEHKPWVWNEETGSYEVGPEREDMFSVAFELEGPFDGNMLSGQEAVWDVWHWKATRTNPVGYAMDRSHRYTRHRPEGKANEFLVESGGGHIWIARPEDDGATVERKQPAPDSREDDRVPQYLLGTPTGSAADVRAKGSCTAGRWTLELGRQLDTGHPDDTAFHTGRSFRFAVATHDRTGEMDKASGVLELVFEQR
ncbi:MAG: ethylbenzene dehydrogenase-related protein [Deltaproteobacteria bacterium]|jgi:hypothetical protein